MLSRASRGGTIPAEVLPFFSWKKKGPSQGGLLALARVAWRKQALELPLWPSGMDVTFPVGDRQQPFPPTPLVWLNPPSGVAGCLPGVCVWCHKLYFF